MPEQYDIIELRKSNVPRSPNFCRTRVTVNGKETTVSAAPVTKLQQIITQHQPKTQEDWKALYWFLMWGSTRSSDIEKVVIQVRGNMCYVWHEPKIEVSNGV